MTDVRLTALNPEDSQVYPVACNTSGELKLEKQETFDGNLDGDLTVEGNVGIGTDSPKRTLHVSASALNPVRIQSSNTGSRIEFQDSNTVANDSVSIGSVGNDFQINTNIGALGGTRRVTVKDNGNVGIGIGEPQAKLDVAGNADFAGNVVVGSRSKAWMLVENGGLCHMVEQVSAISADLVDPADDLVDPAFGVDSAAEYPNLRNVFQELNIIERCLEEVMAKLRMTEPDGWPVWDGSDNSR